MQVFSTRLIVPLSIPQCSKFQDLMQRGHLSFYNMMLDNVLKTSHLSIRTLVHNHHAAALIAYKWIWLRLSLHKSLVVCAESGACTCQGTSCSKLLEGGALCRVHGSYRLTSNTDEVKSCSRALVPSLHGIPCVFRQGRWELQAFLSLSCLSLSAFGITEV